MKKRLIFWIYCVLLMCVCALLYAATGNESGVLTSSVESRQTEPLTKPVWEHVITWTYDSDDTGAETVSVPINGVLLKVVIDIPATTNTGTTSQVLIKDNGDHTVFDSGEQAESDTVPYVFSVYEPLTGTIDVIYEPSGASGSTVEYPVVTLRGI